MKNETDIEFLRYGIEITLSSILNIILILFLSIVFHSLREGILFLTVFISTRQFTGGFHASTYFRCNLVFSLCFLAVLGLQNAFVNLSMPIMIAILIMDLFIVSVLCPIENPNKPIPSGKRYIRFKFLSVLIIFLQGIVSILLVRNGYHIGSTIFYTLQVIAILCILTLVERRTF